MHDAEGVDHRRVVGVELHAEDPAAGMYAVRVGRPTSGSVADAVEPAMQPAGGRAIDSPATGVQGRPHAVGQRASFAGIGEVDDVRVIRVIGDVLDTDELEDVVGVGPILQRLLGATSVVPRAMSSGTGMNSPLHVSPTLIS